MRQELFFRFTDEETDALLNLILGPTLTKDINTILGSKPGHEY